MPKLHVDGKEVAEIDEETAELLLEAASVGVGKRREDATCQPHLGVQRALSLFARLRSNWISFCKPARQG